MTVSGCSDADAGTSLVYSELTAYTQFQIPVSTSGSITLQAALDYETDTEHIIYILVNDPLAAHEQTATVIVTVSKTRLY